MRAKPGSQVVSAWSRQRENATRVDEQSDPEATEVPDGSLDDCAVERGDDPAPAVAPERESDEERREEELEAVRNIWRVC